MLRLSVVNLGLFSVLREELSKMKAVSKYDLDQQLGDLTSSAKTFGSSLKGQDGETQESLERAKRKKDKMMEKLQAEWQKESERKARVAAEREHLPALEKMKLQLADLKEAAAAATSRQAGVVALIQHCTAAHAAEVAEEVDIDVKSVNIVTEQSSVTEGARVVGYIDAPKATEEEVMVFAQRLQKTCPAANLHGRIEWVKAPGDEEDTAGDSVPSTLGSKKEEVPVSTVEGGSAGDGTQPPVAPNVEIPIVDPPLYDKAAMPRFAGGGKFGGTPGPGLSNSGKFTFAMPKSPVVKSEDAGTKSASSSKNAAADAEWAFVQREAQQLIEEASKNGETPMSYHKAVDKILLRRKEADAQKANDNDTTTD